MIDFTRALETAWERMVVILFQPLNPAKWFLIGFNAFLALLAEGGVSINNSIPMGHQDQGYQYTYQKLPGLLHSFVTWGSSLLTSTWLALYIVLALLYVGIWMVGNWIGCRGQFIFLDNVVRNRAALVAPWRQYARQGNVWFLVHLVLGLISVVFYGALAAAFLFLNWTWISANRDPVGGELAGIGTFVLITAVPLILFVAASYLIRSFVIPLYFKQTMGVGAAFLAVARLMMERPGSIFVYLLLSFVLGFAVWILTMLVCCSVICVICWFACIPFIGAMVISLIFCQLLLPLLVFFRCFQLDCLAQFGPLYDVWTVDVPPAALPSTFSPPPPLG